MPHPTTRRYTDAALDTLAARVSKAAASRDGGLPGKRAMAHEAELIAALQEAILRAAQVIIRKQPDMVEHMDDFLSEGSLVALEVCRKYDPAKGHVRTYVYSYLLLELKRRIARPLLSRVSAALTKNVRLDFSEPLFAPYTSLNAPGGDGMEFGMMLACDREASAGREKEADASRHLLKRRLGRLTGEERFVVVSLFGVAERRASQDEWAKEEETEATPQSMEWVAHKIAKPLPEIVLIRNRALAKVSLG